jgi:hypothetical protein
MRKHFFPRQPAKRVDVDQTQEVRFIRAGDLECGLRTPFVDLLHSPVHECEGELFLIDWRFRLPIVGTPIQTSDGKKSTAVFSDLLRISKDDAKCPKQGNQDGRGPVQCLNEKELVSHGLTNEQQRFDDD